MQLVETLVVYQKIYDQLIKIVLLKWKRRGLYRPGHVISCGWHQASNTPGDFIHQSEQILNVAINQHIKLPISGMSDQILAILHTDCGDWQKL